MKAFRTTNQKVNKTIWAYSKRAAQEYINRYPDTMGPVKIERAPHLDNRPMADEDYVAEKYFTKDDALEVARLYGEHARACRFADGDGRVWEVEA